MGQGWWMARHGRKLEGEVTVRCEWRERDRGQGSRGEPSGDCGRALRGDLGMPAGAGGERVNRGAQPWHAVGRSLARATVGKRDDG
ncbi:hypothetical protein NL676_030897 [Syzygium grande]|nr:hypothetical protein NL676_030897 [Syzygium grande]